MGPGAAWFALAEGQPVDLGQRMSARRILHHLALTCLAAPAEAVPMETLARAGWPADGATLSRRKAKNRVHVALHGLRRAGLGEVIVTVDDGYLLTAEVLLAAEVGASPAIAEEGQAA